MIKIDRRERERERENINKIFKTRDKEEKPKIRKNIQENRPRDEEKQNER